MTRFEPVTALLGKPIADVTGKHVGWANELLVDIDEGRIEYVRVTLSDDDGRSSRRIVVPWSAIQYGSRSVTEWRIDARKAVLDSLALRQNARKSVLENSD